MPSSRALPAHEAFDGVLRLNESPMTLDPSARDRVAGRDVSRFPAVGLAFVTVDGDLVPEHEDVIRAGSIGRGESYWDLIVQPGRVWSEPGEDGWSRAAFPFALVHSIEGETHNGIATFAYRRGQVTQLRLQVVQQTAPFRVETPFTASGRVPATRQSLSGVDQTRVAAAYREARRDDIPIRPWSELERLVGADRLVGFADDADATSTVLIGLDYDGTFYLRSCTSAAGPLPWCDRARFGVWSITKALANELSLLRLAQKFGPEVFRARIGDFVPGAAESPYRDVTFDDCINMATGIGDGSTRTNPNDSGDGYLEGAYLAWYEAPSQAAKVERLLKDAPGYPWGPGQVTRYRDQDMFVLGVAMDGYLRSREGPKSDLWSMLQHEVFEPIGIHAAPINRTLEGRGITGQPLMAYGYYATIGDLVKVARLYHGHGRHGSDQILYAPRVDELLYGVAPRGLPTGERNEFGETMYFNAFWEARFNTAPGCELYIPTMIGWGGNLVALYPGGLTAVRIAKMANESRGSAADALGVARVANRLRPFCDARMQH